MFLLVNKETTGTYKCEAVNTEGSTSKEHDILVVTPPSLTNDIYPTKLEVNEGDSLVITCPTEMSVTPSNIQWTKVCGISFLGHNLYIPIKQGYYK